MEKQKKYKCYQKTEQKFIRKKLEEKLTRDNHFKNFYFFLFFVIYSVLQKKELMLVYIYLLYK